jgi:hypothetical protein
VRALLMGGQACILYGAAEFSRDIDLAVLADDRNLLRLQAALDALQASPVFVPALNASVLRRGHERIRFWLREARTSELLVALCRRYPAAARSLSAVRPALRPALRGSGDGVERALQREQEKARALDRKYWEPLRAELAEWRRMKMRRGKVRSLK